MAYYDLVVVIDEITIYNSLFIIYNPILIFLIFIYKIN